ncbi:4Fe-4S dicluster domain-containing protein [Clostridium sp. SM-530-WT-3G]|uniref:4Fe-4S dicluster domain-containing protein n=1 Tax=Clostridium sp. SM-530-WT-3G TaxID=2725303 RepID=UPI00145F27CD|nr:4Fe-4S dicluster domain-containing protein [Clostridium sp. SM-530-WT-3G]NME83135.1 4Fe-4S binding protein [Clostridium sp. SM-530-WT-3G]
MFKLENRLLDLKHNVLTKIANLAKENKITLDELKKIPFEIIPGNVPEYRDTVDHERHVVLERVKLATGYAPNLNDDELNDISEEKQIMYVIKAACDRCPTKKFEVTDACRNCIAHKCQSVCRFGAITYVNGRAYINPNKCKECGLCSEACPYDAIVDDMRPCKKSCPTGAISFSKIDLSSEINESKCINCGSCMAKCPFGAIEDKSQIVKVVNRLVEKSDIYAIVAPAITGQFGGSISFGQIKNSIKKLGFKDMIEVACGADAVTIHEANEFVDRMKRGDKYMTNSCCPGFVEYIEKMIPDQKERISRTVSPMVATGRYIRKIDSNAKVVFIGPCTAKKSEAMKKGLSNSVDYVLTFEELLALLDAFNIDPSKCEDDVVDDASIFGRGFALGGGLTAAIENYIEEKNIKIEFKPVKVSGKVGIKKTMVIAKAGRLNGNFIEGMICDGGCINGAGNVTSPNKAKVSFNKINSTGTKKTVLSDKTLDEYNDINMER